MASLKLDSMASFDGWYCAFSRDHDMHFYFTMNDDRSRVERVQWHHPRTGLLGIPRPKLKPSRRRRTQPKRQHCQHEAREGVVDAHAADCVAARAATVSAPPALSPTRDGPRFIGRRINVWWGGDGVWYAGVISAHDVVHPRRSSNGAADPRHRFLIRYDDGERKYHYLAEGETWELQD